MRPPAGPPIVLGVDPGATATGLALRRGSELLDADVVESTRFRDHADPTLAGLPRPYALEVLRTVAAFAGATSVDLIGLEGVVRPNPHVRNGRRNGTSNVTDPAPIIATAVLVGYLIGNLAHDYELVMVRPARNGSAPLLAYPPELVTDGERRHGLNRIGGSSSMRHARSAWDVAGTAALHARLHAGKHPRTQA